MFEFLMDVIHFKRVSAKSHFEFHERDGVLYVVAAHGTDSNVLFRFHREDAKKLARLFWFFAETGRLPSKPDDLSL